ncbi:lipoprotein insertase outer membrane protein LolB [Neptuniibacter halophilus]|uniref:lipoprotein insertase outer membrane protein LolB n=1 Tax=Neptuniibacter halophilus TaxID=651666 RepID=UPI0025748A51|nr:lipoprotein insertase outer membrane protein LolB [Neptuniibacter halophilus]
MLKRLSMALLCFYLAGCSVQHTSVQPAGAQISWQEHQRQLQQLTRWDLSGKIALRTAEDNHTASLSWIQLDQDYQIDIRGPWGQGGASITGSPRQVSVDIAGEGTFVGSDPESILQQQLGWDLPVSDIYWWVRGLPAPGTAYRETLQNNRLSLLQQNGWEIEYLRYNSLTPALPKKIRMTRQGLKITLLVSTWIRR